MLQFIYYVCGMEKSVKLSQLVSVADYAKKEKKSLAWAYNEIRLGKVKTEKIGKTIFILNKKK